MTRYVALDLETTNLDPQLAFPVEIAAVTYDPDPNTTPGERSDPYGFTTDFVPAHDASIIHDAEPDALAVNRYYERQLYSVKSTPAETAREIDRLIDQLDGATLVGANPAYDATVLWRYLIDAWAPGAPAPAPTAPPWHFRLYDVEVATRVALDLDYTPGLARCRELLGLGPHGGAHTAIGDAWATLDVFHELEQRRAASL
ncbi:exonuclease domain-containing protein [Gordonia sp. CPCC 205333]|uniref:exonuclease domain-containing protein n=1 Tax=Gordonia sp. CPCC 205333 TaxID=3140790 RepID=UPI003AF3C114